MGARTPLLGSQALLPAHPSAEGRAEGTASSEVGWVCLCITSLSFIQQASTQRVPVQGTAEVTRADRCCVCLETALGGVQSGAETISLQWGQGREAKPPCPQATWPPILAADSPAGGPWSSRSASLSLRVLIPRLGAQDSTDTQGLSRGL